MSVTPNSVITPQSVNQAGQTFAPADTTSKKTLLTAGANGTIIRGISAITTDTSANNLQLYINDGSIDYQIGTVRVALASGTDGAAVSVDLLNVTALPFLKIDAAGNYVLVLKAGFILKGACLATVTTAKQLTVFTFGEDL